MLSPIRFLWIWLACLLGFAAVVIGVNLLVDPYDVFGTPRIAGISALKPAAKNHAMLAKTYQVARAHPVTVLIGSSSVHIGIDASDPAWPEAMRPVYNYGIPGTLTSTSLETLREAIAVGKVKNAIVSLDFQNFLVRESPGGVSEEARRFHLTSDGISNPHRLRQTGSDMFFAAFTMGSLIDSVFTVMEQGRPHGRTKAHH